MEKRKKELMQYITEKENLDLERLEEHVERTLEWEDDNIDWITAMRDELVAQPLRVIPFLLGTINGILRANGAPNSLVDLWDTAVRAVCNWLAKPKMQ